AVGALGLIGALASRLLVGAAMSRATVAVLALVCACAMAVVVRQRWTWLGLAAVLVCAPQWGSWVLAGQGAGVDFAVLGAFAALGLIGALGAQTLGDPARLPLGSAALMALSACLVAVIGHLALHDASGRLAAELWLTALAGSHILLGVCRFRRLPVATPMRELAIA